MLSDLTLDAFPAALARHYGVPYISTLHVIHSLISQGQLNVGEFSDDGIHLVPDAAFIGHRQKNISAGETLYVGGGGLCIPISLGSRPFSPMNAILYPRSRAPSSRGDYTSSSVGH